MPMSTLVVQLAPLLLVAYLVVRQATPWRQRAWFLGFLALLAIGNLCTRLGERGEAIAAFGLAIACAAVYVVIGLRAARPSAR